MKLTTLLCVLLALLLPLSKAQAASNATIRPVVVSGTVPDEATRQAIIGKLRAIYGNEQVVDQLGIGKVSAPPNWPEYVQKLLTADLKQISNGEMDINGNVLSLRGDVSNESLLKQIPTQLASQLNPSYQVRNGLRVGTNQQEMLDKSLANRIVEFAPNSSTLTPGGIELLDEMLSTMLQLGDQTIQIIGHTDSQGRPDSNAALSQARANVVRQYFIQRGMSSNQLVSIGKGAMEPIATNETPEGRARNRRIEFRIVN